jgi:hypothetical protein
MESLLCDRLTWGKLNVHEQFDFAARAIGRPGRFQPTPGDREPRLTERLVVKVAPGCTLADAGPAADAGSVCCELAHALES